MVAVETLPAVYAKIENRPGTLQRAAHAIGDRRINIDAISTETVGQTGFLRILTPRAKECVDALRTLGIEAYESQVVVASVPNRPSELDHVASELASAGINVEALTTTPDGRLAIRTSDNDRAAQILRKM